ncbi:peptidoglycan DD-metalloendopeptidase family protein [Myxococcaceae bacterium GXIMD 01537]
MSRPPLLLALLLATASAAAPEPAPQDEAARQAAMRQKLTAQRAALALIQSRKVSVLEGVELLEGMVSVSRRRVRLLERDLAAFRRRVAAAEREEAMLREVLREQVRRLGPRLQVMYRLTRRRPLDVLLSARDFSALVWRSRALQATMQSDLELLRGMQRVAALQRQSTRELKRLQESLSARHAFLQEQARLAREQQDALEQVVVSLSAQADDAKRVVRELEHAETQLTRMLSAMKEGPDTSSFGALKGKLPFPTEGTVEVGFGKVVNPRFNTVTVQKGLDVRAPAGAPVRAVAAGTVVYADALRGYGNVLIVDHGGGYHTLMAHLDTLALEPGAVVEAGTEVGTVGDTGSLKGPYLYFEIRKSGQAIDPAPWLAAPP